jgi:hypothetical protein
MSLFMMLGGDIHEINKDSCLQKHVLHQDPDEILRQNKKMLSYYALKPTPGRKPKLVSTDVKVKVRKYRDSLKKYQFFKNLRIHMEKVRLLCSQVSKRENLKMKLEILEQDIIKQRLHDGHELSGKKRRGGRSIFLEHEPPIVKKTPTGGVVKGRRTPEVKTIEEELDSDIFDEEEDDEDLEELEIDDEEGDEEDEEEEEEEEDEEGEMEDEEEQKTEEPKRKRGRPPKIKPKEEPVKVVKSPLTKSISAPSLSKLVELPLIKRKRGRPPKNPTPQPQGKPNSTSQRIPVVSIEEETPIKRKRGRPRLTDKKPDEKDNKKHPSTSPGAIRPTGRMKGKHPLLKKELQKILLHQSWDMLSSVGSSRATRFSGIQEKEKPKRK